MKLAPTGATWTLLILLPRMLLQRTGKSGQAGRAIFLERVRQFEAGEWRALLETPADERRAPRRTASHVASAERQQAAAQAKISLGEMSRARRALMSSGLAPGTKATLDTLTDPARRPRVVAEPLPPEALAYRAHEPLTLDPHRLRSALRSAGRGSAADLSGTRYEHLRVLLEDDTVWPMFAEFVEALARGDLPRAVAEGLGLGRMVALQKPDGGVRGIVVGAVLRRLVGRALASQFGDAIMDATAPYQFALRTRAGMDALVQTLRILSDADPDLVVLSLDGIGAYDHVRRAAMLRKLAATPSL